MQQLPGLLSLGTAAMDGRSVADVEGRAGIVGWIVQQEVLRVPRPAKRQKPDARNPLKKPWTPAEIRSELELVGMIELALFDKALREDPSMLKNRIEFANGYAGTLRQTAKTVAKLLENYW